MPKLRAPICDLRSSDDQRGRSRTNQPSRATGAMKRKVCAFTVPWLLKALFEKPRTTRELIEATGLGLDGVRGFLKSMHEEKLIHIVDFEFESACYVPVYAFGPGQDVTTRWSPNEKQLLEVLRNSSANFTSKQLAAAINRSISSTRKDINALHKKGYIVQIPGKHSNQPTIWTRNHAVAFPKFGATTFHVPPQPPAPKRPKPPRQSWFSAITF